jgi:hypothetical protein
MDYFSLPKPLSAEQLIQQKVMIRRRIEEILLNIKGLKDSQE